MNTEDRVYAYASAHPSVRHGHTDEVALTQAWFAGSQAAGWMTPAQRRRNRHKGNSPKTHSHEDLLVVVDGDGKARRLPCEKCNTPPRRVPRVGGVK